MIKTLWMVILLGQLQGAMMDVTDWMAGWNLLDTKQKKELLHQIEDLHEDELLRQRAVLEAPSFSPYKIEPFEAFETKKDPENEERGLALLSEGKVGCLIVAGGQGSRLGYDKPKGLFPITKLTRKSFFQLYAEKILAAGARAGRPLFVAIMTSLENHKETVEHFLASNFFGLLPSQVAFFPQLDLPLLDKEGKLFLETPDRLAKGPDGNAYALKGLVDSGILDHWRQEGVTYVHYLPIDNALADPFDAELLGFHDKHATTEITMKCIRRENPKEKLGVLCRMGGKVTVIEYSEIGEKEKRERREDGSLTYLCGNIGLYSLRADFVEDIARLHYHQLPFHKAWKAVKYLDAEGQTKMSQEPIAWKFERFIFDILPFAKDVRVLLVPREECFAPLKNATGDDSPLSVQEALQRKERALFEKITGTKTTASFELDPVFYYPTKELAQRWKGSPLPDTPYVEP